MPETLMSVLPIVLVCTVIQSIFGVGLLVFGTPLLLLMSIPFSAALLYLLPSSLVVSFLQVLEGRRDGEKIPREAKLFLTYSIPFMVLGLLIVLIAENGINMKLAVGAILLLSAVFRMIGPLNLVLTRFIRSHTKSGFTIMGAVHGLSNMGGGLLAIMANTLYLEKRTIRFAIALGYLFFAAMQLALVLIYHKDDLRLPMVFLPLVSLVVYSTLGSRAFKATTEAMYQHLMTAIIFLFGIILLTT